MLLAASLVGCASGSAAQTQDAPLGGGDDAKVWLDGNIEGTPDAPVDAAPHIDARPDAPPDARPIDAPPDACVPQTTELLLNPVFDLSPAGIDWTQVPIDPAYPPITRTMQGGFAAQTAPYKAWMGGIVPAQMGQVECTDVVYQDVVVPAGTTQLVLTGYYVVGTNETTTASYDTGVVDLLQTNGTPIENVDIADEQLRARAELGRVHAHVHDDPRWPDGASASDELERLFTRNERSSSTRCRSRRRTAPDQSLSVSSLTTECVSSNPASWNVDVAYCKKRCASSGTRYRANIITLNLALGLGRRPSSRSLSLNSPLSMKAR